MKILYVASIGGFFPFFKSITKEMLEKGHTIDFAANYSEWPLPDYYKEWGCRDYNISIERSPIKKGNIKAYKQIKKIIINGKYDIVHCHTPVASIITRLACKSFRNRIRVFYTAHGFHFYNGAPLVNWLLYYPIEWMCSFWTDVLITINKEDYKRASEKLHAKKTVYIPGVGVDVKKFAVCNINREEKRKELGIENKFVLLSMVESSNDEQTVIIETLYELKNECKQSNIICILLGSNTEKEKYEKLINKYGLCEQIIFYDHYSDFGELCEISDCYIHISKYSKNSIYAFEAIATGLPLIYRIEEKVPADYISTMSGCELKSINVNEMTQCIEKVSHENDFRYTCAANNWKKAREIELPILFDLLQGTQGERFSHLQKLLIRQKKRAEYGINKDDVVLISVGELNENKNQQVIIQAIQDIPKIKYIIVGKGEQQEQLEKLTGELMIKDRVVFTGYRKDICELLWMSDCFAFPSKREGLGIAALEGMSAGLPVIGHNIGGIRDFCENNKTGWLCNSNECDEYKEIIKQHINENKYAYFINCRQVAMKFDKNESNRIMLSTYLEENL